MMTNSKFKNIVAIICAMVATLALASCGTKQVSGDTPLAVESESAVFNGSFKLLSWNIQDGRWCDQFNNYNNSKYF